MRIFTTISVLLLSGCSSGIVQMDKDTYVLSEKAAGCGFATGSGQEVETYKKANEFCSKKGMNVETISSESKDGIVMARCASATLKFRCVP